MNKQEFLKEAVIQITKTKICVRQAEFSRERARLTQVVNYFT